MAQEFENFFATKKALLNSPVPFGGTVIPGSAGYPSLVAHSIKGGFFVVPDLTVLADIPYPLLSLDMEVVVQAYPGHDRATYFLSEMPPANTRVSEVSGYNINSFWTKKAEPGPALDGDPGDDGWTPVYAFENDGANRVVVKLIDWFGGSGTKPSANSNSHYIGPTGFTIKSSATNLKGPQGDTANQRPVYYVSTGSRVEGGLGFVSISHNSIPASFIRGLVIENTYSQSRDFIINAEVGFKSISGQDVVYAELASLVGEVALPAEGDVRDSLLLPSDWSQHTLNPGGIASTVCKVKLQHRVTLAAGGKQTIHLYGAVLSGGPTSRNHGFIEAFGI